MDLNSILVSEFAKITNDNKETVNKGTTVYGTYRIQDGETYVQIDGSDVRTPVATTSEARNGDRVTVLIKNHRAIVTGNLTDPSASGKTVENVVNAVNGMGTRIDGAERVATNFIKFEEPTGLVVGNMTSDVLGKNVLIDATGIDIRDGDAVLASYTAGAISLGMNNISSKISMCGETFSISAGGEFELGSKGTETLLTTTDTCLTLQNGSVWIGIMSGGLNTGPFGGAVYISDAVEAAGGIISDDLRTTDGYNYITYLDGYNYYSDKDHTHSGNDIYGGTIDCSKVSAYTVNVTSTTKTTNAYAGWSSSNNILQYGSSSKQYKHNVHELTEELKEKFNKLYDIRIKNWTYNEGYLDESDELNGVETFGLIAEDVNDILPEAITHDKDGSIDNYRDRNILNAMLYLLQQQKKKIDELEERIESLENKEVL